MTRGRAPRVFGFAGWSGSGKTTLIERLIPRLVARGLRVSLVKHAHHEFDIDQPGKDSYRHRQAGCTEVLVSSSRRWALMHELRGDAELTLAAGARAAVAVRPGAGRGLQAPADPQARGLAADGRASPGCTPTTRTSSGSPPTSRRPVRRPACRCFALDAYDEIATFVASRARPCPSGRLTPRQRAGVG